MLLQHELAAPHDWDGFDVLFLMNPSFLFVNLFIMGKMIVNWFSE